MNKYDAWIIRSLGVFVPICTGIALSVLIQLKTEVAHLNDIKANSVNVISFASYVAIESVRSEVVAELFCDFGRLVGIKEDELEPFRISSKRKLDRSLRAGTTRGV